MADSPRCDRLELRSIARRSVDRVLRELVAEIPRRVFEARLVDAAVGPAVVLNRQRVQPAPGRCPAPARGLNGCASPTTSCSSPTIRGRNREALRLLGSEYGPGDESYPS